MPNDVLDPEKAKDFEEKFQAFQQQQRKQKITIDSKLTLTEKGSGTVQSSRPNVPELVNQQQEGQLVYPEESEEDQSRPPLEENPDEDESEEKTDEETEGERQPPDEDIEENVPEGSGNSAVEGAATEGAGVAAAGAETAGGVVAAGGSGAGSGLAAFFAATWEIWAVVLGIFLIIGLVVGLFMFISTAAVAYCNDNSATGWGVWLASKSRLTGAGDFCKDLQINNGSFAGGGSGGGGGGSSFWEPEDLVTLVGLVSIDSQASDPRVRQCMANRVTQLFNNAESAGLNITVTSAFRAGGTTAAGSTSSHSRGEAVDIGLRPVPSSNNDVRIDQLLTIANGIFSGAEADVLDEYRNPAENASARHIHVEFNIPSPSTNSYCAPFPNPPA